MTLASFKTIIELLQKQQVRTDMALALKIDILEFSDPIYQVVDILIEEIYGRAGHDWFSWFCYDNDFGRRDWSRAQSFSMDISGNLIPNKKFTGDKFGARDQNGDPICFSIESTWKFLEENYGKKTRAKSKKRISDINKVLDIINGKSKKLR